jgi:hypothetical protein
VRFAPVLLTLLPALLVGPMARACNEPVSVCAHEVRGSFALVRNQRPASLLVDAAADPAVRHAVDSFAADLERVGGQSPQRLDNARQARGNVIIVGVLGKSAAIDCLVRTGKITASDIAEQWEAYRQIVVDRPYPDVARALVIVGADRRGAVYGMYDISGKMGVSPWYWFADVPVRKQSNVFITSGARRDQPRVKYRGFFINDEDPGFNSWAKQHFGGINARMYQHVFELLLRLKGNYLWPAMWEPKAFNDDDPQNMILADAMGVVMGSSHHEPMTRAHNEWHRNTDKGVTGGAWDYTTNAANLRAFWRGGIERMMSKGNGEPYESVVTIGMRGDGDEAMAAGTATQLLENIVADQRRIIEEVTHKPAAQTPQVWALYKEVQDYFDHGMNVPDDVTLLFSDDNWGQIRRLPTPGVERKGGYGVYYHFDYVGGPRNYKWLNTNQIEKTWQQLDLAYARGARSLWIVNVGDIKPMEFPLSFYMQQAWNPAAMTLDALTRYPENWARATFGPEHAREIAELITRYSQYAARRKPELVDADSFALGEINGAKLDGGEFGAIVADWQVLEKQALQLKMLVPKNQQSAYYQLVEHPVCALANLYQLYYAVAWNRKLAAANDARANVFAERAEAAFRRDQEIMAAYHALNGGKWDGMMAQTHIGYTNWQQPDAQVMPEVKRVRSSQAVTPIVFARATGATHADSITIEAPRFSRAVNGSGLTWRVIPHLGSGLGAVTAFPQGRVATTPRDNVRLEYKVATRGSGDLTLQLQLMPTLDVSGKASLSIGVSIDDADVQTIIDRMLPAAGATTAPEQRDWNQAVKDNTRVLEASFPNVNSGRHVIRIWRLDDNVVLQKIVVRGHGIGITSTPARVATNWVCPSRVPVPASVSWTELPL